MIMGLDSSRVLTAHDHSECMTGRLDTARVAR